MSVDVERRAEPLRKMQRKRVFDYRRISPALGDMGFIAKNIDLEKYSIAERELIQAFHEEGYKNFAYAFEQLADYNIIVVPHSYKSGDEIILAKMIKVLKGWNNIRVVKLSRLLIEKADVLEKIGHPLSLITYVLENAPANLEIAEFSGKSFNGKVGVQPLQLSIGGEYDEKKMVTVSIKSVNTVKTAVSLVLDSVDTPTLLIISDRELEAVGAETLLNAVVANPNLVIVTFLPTRPSKEFVKLVTSERVASVNVPVMYASMKTYIINAYLAMSKKLMPGLKDVVQRRANTKRSLAFTIQLLVEMGLLQRAVGIFVYRLVSPMLIMSATNKVIAKMYALLQRSPEKILAFYRRADERTRRMMRNEFLSIIDRLIEEAEAETVMESLNQSAISTIYSMLKSLSKPDKIYTLMKRNTLLELDYPILFNRENEYTVIEFMYKTGILALRATRRGYYTLTPGINYLYITVKSLLAVDNTMHRAENSSNSGSAVQHVS